MKFPPLKYPKAIPDTLFYHVRSGPEKQYHLFNMFSLKNGKKNGFLVLQKAGLNRENYYSGPALFLNYIASLPTGQGHGQTMLDFAKKYSQNNNCNGHIILKSDTSFTPHRIPHLFYRKNGFTTLDKKLDKKMDLFIKTGKSATYKDFPSLIMYYPDPNQCKPNTNSKPSLLTRLKNLFGF